MTPTEAIAALDALVSSCARCRSVRVNVMATVRDRKRVAQLAAHDERGKDWSRVLTKTERDLADQVRRAAEHLGEPHEAPALKPVAASKPVPKSDDRPACPACGTKVSVKAGRIRSHRAASGNQCPRRFFDVDLTGVVRDLPTSLPKAPATTSSQSAKPAIDGASRLEVGSSCNGCGRWLPAERALCGRCSNAKARAG